MGFLQKLVRKLGQRTNGTETDPEESNFEIFAAGVGDSSHGDKTPSWLGSVDMYV